jgi:hypothetical protein
MAIPNSQICFHYYNNGVTRLIPLRDLDKIEIQFDTGRVAEERVSIAVSGTRAQLTETKEALFVDYELKLNSTGSHSYSAKIRAMKKRTEPTHRVDVEDGGKSVLPAAKRAKITPVLNYKRLYAQRCLAGVEEEDAKVARLNETLVGRLELFDTYWAPTIHEVNSSGIAKQVRGFKLAWRPSGWPAIIDASSLRERLKEYSFPLPTRNQLFAALIYRPHQYEKALEIKPSEADGVQLIGNPYLNISSASAEFPKYTDWIEARLVKHILVDRAISSFCSGGVTDNFWDEMRYMSLGTWDFPKDKTGF